MMFREIKAYVDANRTLDTPFDIVLNGKVADLDRYQLQEKLLPLIEAGATWWIEGLWEETEEICSGSHQERTTISRNVIAGFILSFTGGWFSPVSFHFRV